MRRLYEVHGPVLHARQALRWLFAAGAVLAFQLAPAQTPAAMPTDLPGARAAAGERSMREWLLRLQQAPRGRAYAGTFVVSSASGELSSARIAHVCDGVQQMEHVEPLTGAPRSIFRRNDEVVTFLFQQKVVRIEEREAVAHFPNLLEGAEEAIVDFYQLLEQGSERVAGLETDIVQLTPKDGLRYGYRIWSEKQTALIVQLQTLDFDGRVLEQAAFSELRLDAPVSMARLARQMTNQQGYRVHRSERVATTPEAEGWALSRPVPGFSPVSCYRRPHAGGAMPLVQWVFSDGLATVSLFAQVFDPQRHTREGVMVMGATTTLTRRIRGSDGDWWLTAVGEVPPRTLVAFADNLERRRK